MTNQEAMNQAAKERGYPSWENAVWVLNEQGIAQLADLALTIMRRQSLSDGFMWAAGGKDLKSLKELVPGEVTN